MRSSSLVIGALSTALLGAGGCTTAPYDTAPDVPTNLRPPSGQVLSVVAFATGFQIYECTPKAGQPSSYEWTFRAPEAVLADRSGRPIGKHYAGPTWESSDGSSVKGDVKERAPGPTPSAISWLLLDARANSGTGAFRATKSVQRLQTVGGVAPATACGAGNVRQVTKVPYTATYYFYG
ncbi:MAG TPA: DUF3455 domain-containing protein [Casimicrobiaceae bacterium]|jgi:hypothetical protein